jgi:DNA-directed RNA polymerase specialized sigma24 family protein
MQDVCIAYLGKSPLADDLLQEAVINLLEKRQDEKLQGIIDRNEGMYHFAGMVKMMVTRKRTKFYRTFICKKPINRLEFIAAREQNEDERLNEIDEVIGKMRWYRKEISRLYFDESYSFTKLAQETRISRKTLYNDINKQRRVPEPIGHLQRV